MRQAKRASKGKRPGKAVSVLGIAGVSWAASTGGSPADMPLAPMPAPTAGSAVEALWRNTAAFQVPTLDEEEISDVSLATFHLLDEDNLGSLGSGIQLAAFRAGGCGCGHGGGCRGCGGRGCGGGCRAGGCHVGGCRVGGCRGCGVGGCGGCGGGWGWGGCGGCGWGYGWGGYCLSWGGCNIWC